MWFCNDVKGNPLEVLKDCCQVAFDEGYLIESELEALEVILTRWHDMYYHGDN